MMPEIVILIFIVFDIAITLAVGIVIEHNIDELKAEIKKEK